jgi:hypothetical protein
VFLPWHASWGDKNGKIGQEKLQLLVTVQTDSSTKIVQDPGSIESTPSSATPATPGQPCLHHSSTHASTPPGLGWCYAHGSWELGPRCTCFWRTRTTACRRCLLALAPYSIKGELLWASTPGAMHISTTIAGIPSQPEVETSTDLYFSLS